jgi:hypothetical protein
MMNPKKIYLMDTGFSLLGSAFGENRGRLLENLVALEFYRGRRRILYYKGKGECDFIVQQGQRPVEAWQACWELNASNEKREIRGLLEAMRGLKIQTGGILTYCQEETRSVDGVSFRLLPLWRWLLESSFDD